MMLHRTAFLIILVAQSGCAQTTEKDPDEDLYNFFQFRPRKKTSTTTPTTVQTKPKLSDPPVIKVEPPTTIATTTTTTTTTTEKATVNVVTETIICGRRQIHHVGLITGGYSTLPGDWPWHVAIYKLKARGAVQKYACGGTVISDTRVVTAGHCVVEYGAVILPERLTCKFGKYNLAGADEGFQERGVYDIALHPNFGYSDLNNDIAILKLMSKLRFTEYVQPICLWDRSSLDKTNIFDKIGVIVGWGFTENDVTSTTLLSATIPVIGDLECIQSYPIFFSLFVKKTTFCAGYANGTSPCNGDSGGGMYFEKVADDGQRHWYLRGIISLSVSRTDVRLCDPYNYTLFTDSVRYFDFIDENMIR